jgi:hypothetical protein
MKTISILLISSGLAVGAVTTSHAATSPDAPHALLPSAPRRPSSGPVFSNRPSSCYRPRRR